LSYWPSQCQVGSAKCQVERRLSSATCHFSLHLALSTSNLALLGFSMSGVLPAEPAVLAHLEPFGRLLLVLRRAVVPTLAVGTRQRDDVAHLVNPCQGSGSRGRGPGRQRVTLAPESWPLHPDSYARISVIVPAPTVRPPSRIANRAPFSSATGVINSAVIVVLSPGITISTPSGRCSDPVTSVVRM